MASPSTSTWLYRKFRQPSQSLPGDEGALHDHDGAILYETDRGELLRKMIKHNDVISLRQYLAKHQSLSRLMKLYTMMIVINVGGGL